MPINFEPGSANLMPNPLIKYYPNAKSTTINVGDLMALSSANAVTVNNMVVCRPVLSGDITGFYKDVSGNICGLLGISLAGSVTNSSGVPTGLPPTSGVSAFTQPALNVPAYALGIPPEPTNGYAMHPVLIFQPGQKFWGKLLIGNTTQANVGKIYGVNLTAGVFAIDTTIVTTALGAICTITNWNPARNGWLEFQLPLTYCQFFTGFPYLAQ